VNEEIYKNIFQAASDMDEKIVPLEEALLINKPGYDVSWSWMC